MSITIEPLRTPEGARYEAINIKVFQQPSDEKETVFLVLLEMENRF